MWFLQNRQNIVTCSADYSIDQFLHSEILLAVLSILVGVDEADFTYLKKQTGGAVYAAPTN